MSNLIDRLGTVTTNVVDWCKSQFMYYLVYTPEQKAMVGKVREARQAGKLEQFKPIEEYSELYWQIRNELGKAEDPQGNKNGRTR
ncbi:MAG: hypothetical protein AABX29_01615 [Nanoarchaeota archaeon]